MGYSITYFQQKSERKEFLLLKLYFVVVDLEPYIGRCVYFGIIICFYLAYSDLDDDDGYHSIALLTL
jgi:hypothetical protein